MRMRSIVLLCGMVAMLAGCAAGRSAFKTGKGLEKQGDLDQAVLKYAEATLAQPDNSEYRIRFLAAREGAGRKHFANGETFAAEGKYEEARREYEAAVALDPSFLRAAERSHEVRNILDARDLVREGEEQAKNGRERDAIRIYRQASILDPTNKEARVELEKLLRARRPRMDGYELDLKSAKPITLKFRDTRNRDVFAILSQLSGINFVFDEGVKDQNISIYLENATFPQALDILCNMSKLGRKVINESTIILFAKTPDKSKQYDELVVRTFTLSYLDAKKAINLLRTMLQVKKIYVNEDANAVILRDTPDVIDVAQSILDANDLPDAEVLLEVEVIELSRSKTESFGLGLSTYGVSGGLGPKGGGSLFASSLDSSGSTATMVNLSSFPKVNGFMTVPTASFNFGKTLANGDTLSNPRLRVKNREKAKFNVGTKLPITTTSTNGTVGGFTVNVQYVEVGVKLNAEPTIMLTNEVAIKLELEVSSELKRENVGTKDAPNFVSTIGTRNLNTVLSLKDGETSIIGGLIQNNTSNNAKKFYLLGDIPVLGPLLSGYDKSGDKSELVLAITPRVIRSQSLPEPELSRFWSGREDEPFLQSKLVGLPEDQMQGEPASQTSTPEVAPLLPPAEGAPVQAPQPPTPSAPQPAKGSLTLEGPPTVVSGNEFAIQVMVAGIDNLASAPFILQYDPTFVEFLGAEEGSVLKQDGQPTIFQASLDSGAGQVRVAMRRQSEPGKPGVSGGGALAVLRFRARNAGPAAFGLQNITFATPEGKQIELSSPTTVVEIRE